MQIVHNQGPLMPADVALDVGLKHATTLPPANREVEMGGVEDGPSRKYEIAVMSNSKAMLWMKSGVQPKRLR